ncbi:transglycosylase family protein [Streptomyces sp. WMMB 322]|uniref:LysM peptidoglycan-binding domain-containing protein n=1 Tax=Streptomyces sp. WMMB 322 TaxID=1286821 RepID=UPI002670D708|nr:transglycosylase family protein [Streptomyces sp. WMMB 322]
MSGNGRHRRPRQAPNFVVAAGVTGAGLALPLLGATSASAADNSTWDAVAECESGGLWSADEDNGYYGGLQLDQETWEEHGGTEYAERPDLASRDQQITVAESVLDEEGADIFGDCAKSAGLSQDSPDSPDVDPDGSGDVVDGPVAERPYPTVPSTEAPEDWGAAPDPDAAPDASVEPSEPSGSAGPSESGDPSEDSLSSGSGGGSSYEPGGSAGSGAGGDADERPSRDGSEERDGGAGGAGESDAGGKDGTDGEYRVSPGDSLYTIADEQDVDGGWRALYERNRDVVGSDPGLILPGQELRL